MYSLDKTLLSILLNYWNAKPMQQTKMSIIVGDTEVAIPTGKLRNIQNDVVMTLYNKAILYNPPMQAYELVANETGYEAEYIRKLISKLFNKRVN